MSYDDLSEALATDEETRTVTTLPDGSVDVYYTAYDIDGERIEIGTSENGFDDLVTLDGRSGRRLDRVRVPDPGAPLTTLTLATSGPSASGPIWISTSHAVLDPPDRPALRVPETSSVSGLAVDAASPDVVATVGDQSGSRLTAYVLAP